MARPGLRLEPQHGADSMSEFIFGVILGFAFGAITIVILLGSRKR
ncbi:hypothetical protein [Curtobacterium sp. USHLN213]